jgi:hypothetical protein
MESGPGGVVVCMGVTEVMSRGDLDNIDNPAPSV